MAVAAPDLPSPAALQRQSDRLAPARSWLLRRVSIARRRRILDLGAGYGSVTPELARRGGGLVVALDHNENALATGGGFAGAVRTAGAGEQLPFAAASFDLVFSQLVFLWMTPAAAAAEVSRILAPGGVCVAIEPDYGGLIEHPDAVATRDLWWAGLSRAGATPDVGRRLPGLFAAAGCRVQIELMSRVVPPSPDRFALLEGLPLTDAERAALAAARTADAALPDSAKVVHLPFFLITALRT